MTIPSGGKVKARSIVASLAIGLWFAPGCNQAEGPASPGSQPPPNPSPRADLPRTVEPRVPASTSKDISNVGKDLRKDLGSPVIKPDATTPTPPDAKTDTGKTGPP